MRSLLAVCILLVSFLLLSACSKGGHAPDADATRIGEIDLQIDLANGMVLRELTYELAHDNGYHKQGAVPLNRAASVVFQIGGIPQAEGYVLALSATTSEGAACSSDPRVVTVRAAQTTLVRVTLRCGGGLAEATKGSVAVQVGVVQEADCPASAGYTLLPDRVAVGEMMTLTAYATTPDATFSWSALPTSVGSFSGASSAATTFTCLEAAEVALSLQISGPPGCSSASQAVMVTCSAAEGSADAAVEPEDDAGLDAEDSGTSGNIHPLAGNYAVLSRFDLVEGLQAWPGVFQFEPANPATLYSIARIDDGGRVSEEYCGLSVEQNSLLRPGPRPSIRFQFSQAWTLLEDLEVAAPGEAMLVEQDGVFLRPSIEIRSGWSSTAGPSECEVGTYVSGCYCGDPRQPPRDANDCRISSHGDRHGETWFAEPETSWNPENATGWRTTAATFSLAWELSIFTETSIQGTAEVAFNSLPETQGGEGTGFREALEYLVCRADVPRVQLVPGDFDCADLLSGAVPFEPFALSSSYSGTIFECVGNGSPW